MSEKRIRPVGFIGKDILAIEVIDPEIKRLKEECKTKNSIISLRNAEIERGKVAFKTVYEQLENARETILERDALIKELASALSERLKPDKVRTLLDRALTLNPGHPQRRAAEMDVQGSIGRYEMER